MVNLKRLVLCSEIMDELALGDAALRTIILNHVQYNCEFLVWEEVFFAAFLDHPPKEMQQFRKNLIIISKIDDPGIQKEATSLVTDYYDVEAVAIYLADPNHIDGILISSNRIDLNLPPSSTIPLYKLQLDEYEIKIIQVFRPSTSNYIMREPNSGMEKNTIQSSVRDANVFESNSEEEFEFDQVNEEHHYEVEDWVEAELQNHQDEINPEIYDKFPKVEPRNEPGFTPEYLSHLLKKPGMLGKGIQGTYEYHLPEELREEAIQDPSADLKKSSPSEPESSESKPSETNMPTQNNIRNETAPPSQIEETELEEIEDPAAQKARMEKYKSQVERDISKNCEYRPNHEELAPLDDYSVEEEWPDDFEGDYSPPDDIRFNPRVIQRLLKKVGFLTGENFDSKVELGKSLARDKIESIIKISIYDYHKDRNCASVEIVESKYIPKSLWELFITSKHDPELVEYGYADYWHYDSWVTTLHSSGTSTTRKVSGRKSFLLYFDPQKIPEKTPISIRDIMHPRQTQESLQQLAKNRQYLHRVALIHLNWNFALDTRQNRVIDRIYHSGEPDPQDPQVTSMTLQEFASLYGFTFNADRIGSKMTFLQFHLKSGSDSTFLITEFEDRLRDLDKAHSMRIALKTLSASFPEDLRKFYQRIIIEYEKNYPPNAYPTGDYGGRTAFRK